VPVVHALKTRISPQAAVFANPDAEGRRAIMGGFPHFSMTLKIQNGIRRAGAAA
jgi:hypothetical protein